MGVMDRFLVFDSNGIGTKLDAIRTFFDYFYDDERYAAWAGMEGCLPVTRTGGRALAAADSGAAKGIGTLSGCRFYAAEKAFWAAVKPGVIRAQQQALLGGDVRELLDNLQAEITAAEE